MKFINKDIIYYFIFLFLIIVVFFYKNELNNWLEGDIENIYLIYNVIITSNSIVPSVVDYPGNSSFVTYSLMLKLISFFDNLVILNLNDLINNARPELILNRIYIYLKLIQHFYAFLIAVLSFILLNFVIKNKRNSCLLTCVFISSPPFIENLTRLRIDIDSLLFFLISIFFLTLSAKKSLNNFFIFFSGFFLCFSLFSKTAIIFLTFSIPIISLFILRKNINLKNIFQEFKDKQLYFLFIVFNLFQLILINVFKEIFTFIFLITNNLFYFSFYIFFSIFFKSINVKKVNFCLLIFIIGFIFSIILMYIVALDLTKIYFVLNPIATFVYQIDITDSKNFLSLLTFMFDGSSNIKISYLDFILLFIFFYLFFKNLKKKIIVNLLLFSLFLIYKIIFISKYSLYYDIYPLFLLIILIAVNSELKSSYVTIIYSIIFITSLYVNSKYLLNTSYNKIIKDDSVCYFKELNKKEFENMIAHENFLLYYAPKFAVYEFVQKLCENK